MTTRVRIGTAGWAIPRQAGDHFPTEGSGLLRYSSRFDAAEINSTFSRSHRPQTLERWAASVSNTFRFSVKMPKAVSHVARLVHTEELVATFADETRNLGSKLGPWLLQLPPSLAYDRSIAEAFFTMARKHSANDLVCEPRHPSWFDGEADQMLALHNVARVAASPARTSGAAIPGGASHLAYYRLHGEPRTYYSAYGAEFLDALAVDLRKTKATDVWCIFDNTASGAATGNALELQQRLSDLA